MSGAKEAKIREQAKAIATLREENLRLASLIGGDSIRQTIETVGKKYIERISRCWEIVGRHRAYTDVIRGINVRLERPELPDDVRRALLVLRGDIDMALHALPKAPEEPFGEEGLVGVDLGADVSTKAHT